MYIQPGSPTSKKIERGARMLSNPNTVNTPMSEKLGLQSGAMALGDVPGPHSRSPTNPIDGIKRRGKRRAKMSSSKVGTEKSRRRIHGSELHSKQHQPSPMIQILLSYK